MLTEPALVHAGPGRARCDRDAAVGVRRGPDRDGGAAVPGRLPDDRQRGAIPGRKGIHAEVPEQGGAGEPERQPAAGCSPAGRISGRRRAAWPAAAGAGRGGPARPVPRLLRQHPARLVPQQRHPAARFEGHYAGVFYSHFAALGLDIRVEETTSHGRIDMAVEFAGAVWLFEFKVVELVPEGGRWRRSASGATPTSTAAAASRSIWSAWSSAGTRATSSASRPRRWAEQHPPDRDQAASQCGRGRCSRAVTPIDT